MKTSFEEQSDPEETYEERTMKVDVSDGPASVV